MNDLLKAVGILSLETSYILLTSHPRAGSVSDSGEDFSSNNSKTWQQSSHLLLLLSHLSNAQSHFRLAWLREIFVGFSVEGPFRLWAVTYRWISLKSCVRSVRDTQSQPYLTLFFSLASTVFQASPWWCSDSWLNLSRGIQITWAKVPHQCPSACKWHCSRYGEGTVWALCSSRTRNVWCLERGTEEFASENYQHGLNTGQAGGTDVQATFQKAEQCRCCIHWLNGHFYHGQHGEGVGRILLVLKIIFPKLRVEELNPQSFHDWAGHTKPITKYALLKRNSKRCWHDQ